MWPARAPVNPHGHIAWMRKQCLLCPIKILGLLVIQYEWCPLTDTLEGCIHLRDLQGQGLCLFLFTILFPGPSTVPGTYKQLKNACWKTKERPRNHQTKVWSWLCHVLALWTWGVHLIFIILTFSHPWNGSIIPYSVTVGFILIMWIFLAHRRHPIHDS